MTTNTAARSAILDSLRNHQPHPIIASRSQRISRPEVKTMSQQPTATTIRPARYTYAEADAIVNRLPEGRFALPRTVADGSGNMINFFKVFKTQRGNRIVMLIARGGQDYDEQRLSVAHQVAAAQHILEDVMAARQLYGQKTGHCGDCGRALSNEESLAYG